MSIWSDIQDRSAAITERKENEIFCNWIYGDNGRVIQFQKYFDVPDDIRAIFIYFVLQTHNGSDPIKMVRMLWTYKLRNRNYEEFESIVIGLEEEFGRFTYYPDEVGLKRISEESEKMIKELRRRVKEHNEEICGISLPMM